MFYLIVLLILTGSISVLYYLFMSSYSQVFGKFIWHGDRSIKKIAITFDDGPNNPYTEEILDILKQERVKATFFMVGKCILRDPDTAKKILNDGHVIGNHSLTHSFSNYLKSLSFKEEITANQKIIESTLGVIPALYRSPWLFRQPILLRTLKKLNLSPISGQFCHPMEVSQIDSKKIANHVLKIAQNGSIIIFHDGKESVGGNRLETVNALRIVIPALKRQGYKLVTVSELLNIQAYN